MDRDPIRNQQRQDRFQIQQGLYKSDVLLSCLESLSPGRKAQALKLWAKFEKDVLDLAPPLEPALSPEDEEALGHLDRLSFGDPIPEELMRKLVSLGLKA